MAASRENADDDDTTVDRGAQPAAAGHRRSLYRPCWRGSKNATGDVGVETFASPTPFAADRCSRRWRHRARAAWPRIRRSPNWSARSRISASRSMRSWRAEQRAVAASDERDEKGVQAIHASINALRAERDKARQEISKRFPAYAELIDPKPPTVEQIKATLTDGEAMLSFYFGRIGSFVWAVPKTARSRLRRSRRPAATSKARSASCARRWSRRRR